MAGVPVRSLQQRRGLRTGQFAANAGEMRVSPQRRCHGSVTLALTTIPLAHAVSWAALENSFQPSDRCSVSLWRHSQDVLDLPPDSGKMLCLRMRQQMPFGATALHGQQELLVCISEHSVQVRNELLT